MADTNDDARKASKPIQEEPSDSELLDSIRIPSHPLGALSSDRRKVKSQI